MPLSPTERAAAVVAAANRLAAAAGAEFSVSTAPDGTATIVESANLRGCLSVMRNPGPTDDEWIFTVDLEGSPESIATRLAAMSDGIRDNAGFGF